MKRPLVVAIVGGLVLASLLGAVWVFGGEEVGSTPTGEEMTQDPTGAALSTDDIGSVNYANLTDEREGLSSVDPTETDNLDATVEEQNVIIETPSETDATVRSPSNTAVEAVEVLEDADENTDQRTIESCTEIAESGGYELTDDIEGEAAEFADGSGDACLRITASDVVLDGNDNALIGAGEKESIGVLVASREDVATENVTIRNLGVESWNTGIQIGIEYDNPSDARLENVIANENRRTGIYVEDSNGVDIEGAEAHRNGGSGIGTGEEGDLDSLVDVTANENDAAGVALDHTSDLVAEEITVSENGGHGLLLGWRVYTSEFTDVTATNNDGDGLHLDTDVNSNEFSEITSSRNAGHGVYLGIAGGNVFRDSTIEGNGDVGVRHVEDGSEYVNVTIRGNEEWQVETNRWAPFAASKLEIGDTAEFAIDGEPVSLDYVDRNELAELPEDAQAVGDGIEIEGIEDSVDVILEYDNDVDDGQIELWRYDGDEWTSEETVDETDGSIESTLTEDGIYAPVLIKEGDGSQVIDSCTVISEPGVYELDGDVEGEKSNLDDGSDACIRIDASDVVLDGNDNAIVGAGEEESIGILVSGVEDVVAENVTIRNLRSEGWDTGIKTGSWSETRLEDVIASENEGAGVFVSYAGSAEFETVEANRNGGAGIHVSEGSVDSMVDVTANGNKNDGIDLGETSDVVVAERITANGNGGDGIRISKPKDGVIAEEITVSGNSKNGISFWSDVYSSEFSEVYASDNAKAGIGMYADSSGNVIRDSTIENNGGPGIEYVENERNEFQNVTVRNNRDWQVDTYTGDTYIWFDTAELRIGDTAEFVFEEESVSLDYVDRDELEELPEDAHPVGDGIEVEGIEDSVDVTLEYDNDVEEGRIELWRYDGEEWTSEKSVDEADGSIESTLTKDGIYAPILIAEDEPEVDLDITVDERDVTVANQHDTAVDVAATDDGTGEERLIEIGADETVTEELEPGDYTLRGEAEDERPVTLNGEEKLTITVIASNPPQFTVSDLDLQNVTVSEGDEIDVSATIENVGGATGTQTVEFTVAGHTATEVVSLEANESTELSFTWTPNANDVGTHTIRVASENESSTTDLVVDSSADDAADDEETDGDEAADETDDSDAVDSAGNTADNSADDAANSATDVADSADGSAADAADSSAADDVADEETDDVANSTADVTDEETDDEGAADSADEVAVEDSPGFGIRGAVVSLGVTAYLLKRRLADTGTAST